MTDEPRLAGGCLCGAVRYLARGPALNVRACHCRTCQKAAGGPMFVRAVFPAAAVDRTGELVRYATSARLRRAFCPACGVLVFAEPQDRPQFLALNVATLDVPDALAPEMHIWTSSRQAWLQLADGLPQHPEGHPW